MKLFWVALACILLAGCASLGELVKEIPNTDPTAEISAVTTLTDDVVSQPWDNILQIALGYSIALLRRWYKQKQGAK